MSCIFFICNPTNHHACSHLPCNQGMRLTRGCTWMQEVIPTGRPVLAVEACRGAGIDTPEALAAHAAALARAGADAIVIK